MLLNTDRAARETGEALGGALQAAWCVALSNGNPRATLSDFTTGTVALDEATRCVPNKANLARYRELQTQQDKLSLALRDVFLTQRKLASDC